MYTGPESRSGTQGNDLVTSSIALAKVVASAVGRECRAVHVCLGIGIVLPPLSDVLC